jgi:Domain of unknown function (DUF4424)
MGFLRVLWAVLAVFVLACGAARANDSEAELAIGGLVLKQSSDVSLDSEDLYISADEVRVDYRFTNTGAKDVDTLVAFPLPDQMMEMDSARGVVDFSKDFTFATTVDGVPAKYELVTQAFLKDVDVTARLAASKAPMIEPQGGYAEGLKGVAAADVAALVKDGLFENMGDEAQPDYLAKWSIRTSVTRHQVFPAGKTVSVKHRYKPVAGGSVGGGLSKEYRNADWAKSQIAKYCIDKDWFAAFDRAVAERATKDNAAPYGEVWLGYVLKSGANWKGPIKDFRLVVDKGKAENLVSFCAEGVKKISPTQFEVRKKDYEPDQDLNVLVVNWWKAG